MEADEQEEALLRSAALQNANSILLARRQAEEELFRARDALERRTGELAHSLSMMRATLESTTDGILVTDDQGHVTGFNEKFVKMWRLPGEAMSSMVHRRLQESVAGQLKDPGRFLARGVEIYESWPPETLDVFELADGRVFERYSKIQSIGERNVGRVWSLRDITDRRRAERELREQGEWFRVTLGSIGDAVITVDTECRVTFLNPVAATLTGWETADAVGRRMDEVLRIVNEETREPASNPIGRALAEGIVVGLANHTTLIGRDGSEVPIEDSAAPIKNPAGGIIGAVMVFHDVTERREKERALARLFQAEQQARDAAEQASKAKDHFLAALSHELRTPLTPALAILSSLREDASLPKALAEDLETVRRNVELEARLIDDMLDLTRIVSGKLELHCEPVSVSRLIDNAIKTCVVEIESKNLSLVREFEVPSPTIQADSARITQIVWNLLKNAAKFTPAGGTITVRAQARPAQGGKRMVIEVQDTGIGIEPAIMDRVFESFQQGGRKITQQFGGLGLGLAISKAIAEAHGGAITAASPGTDRGSTFTVTLPFDACDETRPAGEPSTALPSPGSAAPGAPKSAVRPLRVLLVEDHADTAAILVRLLRRSGHDVIHAATGSAALQAAGKAMEAGGLDLVISDLGLPDGSGLDVMRELSAKYGLRGIALSGFGMESDREQSAAAGFSRHLTKPINIALMRSTIAEMMREQD